VDITIVTNMSSSGWTFIRHAKQLTPPRITKEGGIIIVASLCDNGVGPRAFCDLHASSDTPGQVLKRIKDEEVTGVCWQNQILARAQQNHTIFLLSSLDDKVVKDMHIHPISSIENGIAQALSIVGKNAEIAVIPEGPRSAIHQKS
jgi:nickel-dependent lactate racemase